MRHIIPATLLLLTFSAGAQTAPAPFLWGNGNPTWTATTHEAASGPEHKKALAKGKPLTVTGELVDYSCFLQLAKTGPKHRDCGRKCILAGQPAGLLTANGTLYLLMPEEHHPRRDGEVSLKEFLAAHVSETLTVSGMLTKYKNAKALFVGTLSVGPVPGR